MLSLLKIIIDIAINISYSLNISFSLYITSLHNKTSSSFPFSSSNTSMLKLNKQMNFYFKALWLLTKALPFNTNLQFFYSMKIIREISFFLPKDFLNENSIEYSKKIFIVYLGPTCYLKAEYQIKSNSKKFFVSKHVLMTATLSIKRMCS